MKTTCHRNSDEARWSVIGMKTGRRQNGDVRAIPGALFVSKMMTSLSTIPTAIDGAPMLTYLRGPNSVHIGRAALQSIRTQPISSQLDAMMAWLSSQTCRRRPGAVACDANPGRRRPKWRGRPHRTFAVRQDAVPRLAEAAFHAPRSIPTLVGSALRTKRPDAHAARSAKVVASSRNSIRLVAARLPESGCSCRLRWPRSQPAVRSEWTGSQ